MRPSFRFQLCTLSLTSTGESTLVAIISRGASDSLGVNYRVDTAEALDFFNQVIGRVQAGEL